MRIMPLASAGGLTLAAGLAIGCKPLTDLVGGSRVCAGVGYYAVQVTVRSESGEPLALGATVTLVDGAYEETDSAVYDPLNVLAAEERGGRTYDVHVVKQFYNDVWVRGVRAPGGGCVTGHESSPVTVTVPVVLKAAAGAPAVRSVYLLPVHVLLDRPPYQTLGRVTPYVDASAGTSRAVSWRIMGDTGSVIFDPVTGLLGYRCLPKSGYLKLIATSVADPSVSGMADIAVQGHPANASDPPCA
jgi:hypothetical protein